MLLKCSLYKTSILLFHSHSNFAHCVKVSSNMCLLALGSTNALLFKTLLAKAHSRNLLSPSIVLLTNVILAVVLLKDTMRTRARCDETSRFFCVGFSESSNHLKTESHGRTRLVRTYKTNCRICLNESCTLQMIHFCIFCPFSRPTFKALVGSMWGAVVREFGATS